MPVRAGGQKGKQTPEVSYRRDRPHLILAGLNAGATPLRTSRHQLSVMPVTRSGWPVADIICTKPRNSLRHVETYPA